MVLLRRCQHFGVFPQRTLDEGIHDPPLVGSGIFISGVRAHPLKKKVIPGMKEHAGDRAAKQGRHEFRAQGRTLEDCAAAAMGAAVDHRADQWPDIVVMHLEKPVDRFR
ncbi:hypothetical protein D3C80_1012890 [compost metagenome]